MKKKGKGKYFARKERFDQVASKIFMTFVMVLFLAGATFYFIDYVQTGEDRVPSLGYGYILKSTRAIVMGGFIVAVILGIYFHFQKKKK